MLLVFLHNLHVVIVIDGDHIDIRLQDFEGQEVADLDLVTDGK